MLTVRVFEDPDALDLFREEWDGLAVETRRPFAAPAWVLAWWTHLRSEDTRLRAIFAYQGDRLVGVLPLAVDGRCYSVAGSSVSPVEPLSRAGLESDVAAAIAPVLADLTPHPVSIELKLHSSAPDWAELLGRAWPGRRGVWRWASNETAVPFIDLGHDGFDGWMEAKSASFRRDVRRKRRRLEADGASFRFANRSTLERDVNEFMRLHRIRLAGRGGSSLIGDGVESMLIAAGSELLPAGRFRLLCLEIGEKTVAVQLLLAAGGEVSAWNSGFDEEYADYSPSMQCMVQALEDSIKRGARTMSLGPGGQDYKYRLANRDEHLTRHLLLPRGGAYPLARLRLALRQVRREVGKRLSPEIKRRLSRLGRG